MRVIYHPLPAGSSILVWRHCISKPTHTANYRTFGHLTTPCWLTHLWSFTHMVGVEIHNDTPIPTLCCIRDHYLIKWLHSSGFKGKELLQLNRCLVLFLQVFSLANIKTGDGKQITHKAWFGQCDLRQPRYYTWPNQGDPSTQDWKLWQCTLSLCFCSGQSQQLTLPLGSWTDNSISTWIWFFTLTTYMNAS